MLYLANFYSFKLKPFNNPNINRHTSIITRTPLRCEEGRGLKILASRTKGDQRLRGHLCISGHKFFAGVSGSGSNFMISKYLDNFHKFINLSSL